MLRKTLGVVGCALLALSCAATPSAKPAAPPSASATPTAPLPRTASAEVSRYWIFDAKAQFQLYAGLGSLMRTELFAGLVPAILAESGDLLKATQRDCIQALATHARELLVGADERSGLLILELGSEGVKATRSACVGSIFPVERVSVAGADEAYAAGDDVVVVQPGVVLFGSKAIVETALAAARKPMPVPASLALRDDQQLAFRFNREPGVSASGGLRVSSERFRFEAEVDLPSDQVAEVAEQELKLRREQAKAFAQSQPGVPLERLLGALDVQRHGKRFTAAFELREPVVDQARDLGVLIGVSVYGVRRYIGEAKTAEARAVMAQIASSYNSTLHESAAQGKAGTVKKLASLPAVPSTVPRGVKYQSVPDDWKAWASVHFALIEPQYFQYEVVAAKDGKSAEIFARGDLNGDGKASLFRIKVALDAKTGGLTAVEHTEQEPLE